MIIGLSKSGAEENEPERSELERFSGLCEHLSRSYVSIITITEDIPKKMVSLIRDAENISVKDKYEATLELGRVLQLIYILNELYTNDIAGDFFDRPKNVKRFMEIMSHLLEIYWSYRDGKISDYNKVEEAIFKVIADLESFLTNVIRTTLNNDNEDNDSNS